MRRMFGVEREAIDRFTVLPMEDIAFGKNKDFLHTGSHFSKHERSQERRKLSPCHPSFSHLLDKELSLKNSGRSLDTSPFSVTSVDSAIGDVYSSNSMDMNRSLGKGVSPSNAKTIIDSLLTNPSSDVGDFKGGVSPSSHQGRPSVINSNLSHPPLAETPPSLRQQRRKYQEHQNIREERFERSHQQRQKYGPSREEVEYVCASLVSNYHHGLSLFPPANPATCMSGSADPLLVATQLLTDSLSRLRVFLSGLDTCSVLSPVDRNLLYSENACSLSILKASLGLNLSSCPVAFPLPCGENLGEVEALHLITAHELYNQLRGVMQNVQELGIRELPVMLLLMMVAFFQPLNPPRSSLEHPEKVVSIHNFYRDKLQAYLEIRFGESGAWSMLHTIYQVIERVKQFSTKLRDFLEEVTTVGLQAQYEAVTENLGLIAYLMQWEQPYDS